MPKYNHRYEEFEDNLYEVWTNQNGTEVKVRLISSDDDDDEDMPDGCKVCGNADNYPDCREGCLD